MALMTGDRTLDIFPKPWVLARAAEALHAGTQPGAVMREFCHSLVHVLWRLGVVG